MAPHASIPSRPPSGAKSLTILTLAPAGQDAAREHRYQLPGQRSQGYARSNPLPTPCPALLTRFVCHGKAQGRFISQVSVERAESLSQRVRIKYPFVYFLPLSTPLSFGLDNPFPSNVVGALMYFEQYVSRLLRTMAQSSLCLVRHDQWMTRPTPYSFSLQVEAARYASCRLVLASNLHCFVHPPSNDRFEMLIPHPQVLLLWAGKSFYTLHCLNGPIMYRNNIPRHMSRSSHIDIVVWCCLRSAVNIIDVTKAECSMGVVEFCP